MLAALCAVKKVLHEDVRNRSTCRLPVGLRALYAAESSAARRLVPQKHQQARRWRGELHRRARDVRLGYRILGLPAVPQLSSGEMFATPRIKPGVVSTDAERSAEYLSQDNGSESVTPKSVGALGECGNAAPQHLFQPVSVLFYATPSN